MPVYKNIRTGATFEADADYVSALREGNFELVAEESPAEKERREIAEAVAAKVEVEGLTDRDDIDGEPHSVDDDTQSVGDEPDPDRANQPTNAVEPEDGDA